MPGIIRISRLFLLIILSVVFLVFGGMINAVFFIAPGKRVHLLANGMKWWAQLNCIILGIHVTCSGEYERNKAFFIASNHCSYLDILIIGAVMPSVFVSKKEVASWVFLGRLARLAGTVFVDRESGAALVGALETIKERLRRGVSIVVFPEGTTNNGITMREFKSSFFKASIDGKVPVLPVSILYSHIERRAVTPLTIDAVAWHSDMSFLPHFWNLLGLMRIDVLIHCSAALYHFTGDRKQLSSAVFKRVKDGIELLTAGCRDSSEDAEKIANY